MDNLIASLQALGVGMINAVPYDFVADLLHRCNGVDVDCGNDSIACFHISIEQMKYALTCSGEASLVTRFL